MASQGVHGIVARMIGAARLDVTIYEEVENDTSATTQAFGVVGLVALATGIAYLTNSGLAGLLIGFVAHIAGWAIWAWIVYLIGTKILPVEGTHADWGQLARTLGFAQTPGMLRALGVLPAIGYFFLLAASVWMLVAMVTAVRQALDYTSTRRAVGVVLLGFIPYLIVMSTLMTFLGTLQ